MPVYFREALHEVYITRIQRGNACFAAKVLGATGRLLSVLVHFFEDGRWGSPVETAIEGQSLSAEDQLFILMQAGLYLNAARGMAALETRICYERAEPLCHSLGRPLLLCAVLIGQWRYSIHTDKMSAAMQIAERVRSLAQEQNNAALTIEAYRALACTLLFVGDFERARQYAMRAVQIWRSGNVQLHSDTRSAVAFQMLPASVVACLCHLTLAEWHLGEITSSQATIVEAISLAKRLNDTSALAIALAWAATLGECERNPAEVDRLASELIELSTRHHFGHWLPVGAIYRGWARSASGKTAEGTTWIEQGIRDSRATGSVLGLPYFLGLKAEVLHLADRTSEALKAIEEAEKVIERSEQREWCAELHRLRGVFLASLGADETQIEDLFCEAVRIAKEQKSVSLEKRAEATYAEYRRQKASGSGERFRLPLC
jgi:predicted ATPase